MEKHHLHPRWKAWVMFIAAALNLGLFGFDRHVPSMDGWRLALDLALVVWCSAVGIYWLGQEYKDG